MTQSSVTRKPTVLVAGGEPLTRIHIAYELRRRYRVLLAADGIDAARQYESRACEIAAVITDLRLPRLGGGPLVEWLHHLNPRLPIIIVAGGTLNDEMGPLVDDPRVMFIAKPFERQQLTALLDESLAAGRED